MQGKKVSKWLFFSLTSICFVVAAFFANAVALKTPKVSEAAVSTTLPASALPPTATRLTPTQRAQAQNIRELPTHLAVATPTIVSANSPSFGDSSSRIVLSITPATAPQAAGMPILAPTATLLPCTTTDTIHPSGSNDFLLDLTDVAGVRDAIALTCALPPTAAGSVELQFLLTSAELPGFDDPLLTIFVDATPVLMRSAADFYADSQIANGEVQSTWQTIHVPLSFEYGQLTMQPHTIAIQLTNTIDSVQSPVVRLRPPQLVSAHPLSDSTPPETIENVSISNEPTRRSSTNADSKDLSISFRTPLDSQTPIWKYDVRALALSQLTESICESDFFPCLSDSPPITALDYLLRPALPRPAGSTEELLISVPVAPAEQPTTYLIAIRSQDTAGNWSAFATVTHKLPDS